MPVSTHGTGKHSPTTHLVQLGTWNVQGKALDEVMFFLETYRLDFMVAGVQEITATNVQDTSYEFVEFPSYGMQVLVAKPTG